MSSKIIASTTSGTALNMSADTSGILEIQTGSTPTTAITVDASQNVTLNNVIPSGSTVPSNGMFLPTTNSVGFSTASTERMRIDSSGNLLVGLTTAGLWNANCWGVQTGSGFTVHGHINGTSTGTAYTYFDYNNSPIGSIGQSGTTGVSYNTTSDYRLKTDVAPIQNALATVEALNPVSFTWIDGRKDDGFLAHEIQVVIPNCVTGEKDAVNEDGTPKYQQMDNSGVIPFLVKAIQEQQALITSLTTRLTALENK
jgi:hypothetical protein